MKADRQHHNLTPDDHKNPSDWDDEDLPEEDLEDLDEDMPRPLLPEDDDEDLLEDDLDQPVTAPKKNPGLPEGWPVIDDEGLDDEELWDDDSELLEDEMDAEIDEEFDDDEEFDLDDDENNASAALIENFLTQTGGTPGNDWRETELPPDYRSGFVALIGRPNVGKSTLVNALMGQKIAIVSPKPQTTRQRISAIYTQPDYQVIFIDTPGIHNSPYQRLGSTMNEHATSAIPDADVILFVVDISAPPGDEDRRIAALLRQKASKKPLFFVMNKMDVLPMERAKERIETYWALYPNYTDSIPTSALHDRNIELLRKHILEHIPQGPRYYPDDQLSDQTERQIAAELIREAALHYTHQEVPHATAVLIEEFLERPNGDLYVNATIWVEKDSQKPILIGKQGQMLKRIGAAARKELERFVGGHVFLDLWVKVRPNWRDREQDLQELGLK